MQFFCVCAKKHTSIMDGIFVIHPPPPQIHVETLISSVLYLKVKLWGGQQILRGSPHKKRKERNDVFTFM